MDTLSSSVRSKIKQHLPPGKEPRLVYQNSCSKTGEAGESWLVATDTLFLIGSQSLTGDLEFTGHPLAKITGIERDVHGFGRGRLVFLSGTEVIDRLEYSALDSDKFQTVDQEILALVRKTGARPAPPPVPAETPKTLPLPTPPVPPAAAQRPEKATVPRKAPEKSAAPPRREQKPTRAIPRRPRRPLRARPEPRPAVKAASPPAAPAAAAPPRMEERSLRPAGGKGSPAIVVLLPSVNLTAGEVIPVRVRLRQTRPVACRGVRLHLRGTETTRISHGSGKNRSTSREHRIIVDEEHVLFGRRSNPAGENIADAISKLFSAGEFPVLPGGEHEWQTRIGIPKGALPSYSGNRGSVRYTLKAYVDVPLTFDVAKHIELTVKLDQERRRYRFRQCLGDERRKLQFGSAPGDIRLQAEFDELVWGRDAKLRGRVRFENPRRHEVRGLKVDAHLVEEAHAQGHVRKGPIDAKHAYSRLAFNDTVFDWRAFSVPVPGGPPPFEGRILRVDLVVTLALDLPWKANIQAEYIAANAG